MLVAFAGGLSSIFSAFPFGKFFLKYFLAALVNLCRTWVVSESELGVWGSLLKCTKATSKNWNDIVDGIAHRLGEQDTAYW